MTVSPAQQEGAPNVAVTYTVAVTNNDTGCESSSFSENVTAPPGWTMAFGVAALSPGPGATVTTTLSVKPPASAAAGTYSIVPSATNTAAANFVGSATATYAVAGSGGGGSTGGGGPTGGGDTVVAETFSDGFARPDSSAIGNGWSEVKGDFSVKGGELRSGPTRALHVAVLPGADGAKERVAASFASVDNGYSPRFGLIVRYGDASNYYVCYRLAGGTSVLRISKVVNGLEIVLKSAPIPNPAKDAMFRMSCAAEGSTLTLEVGSSRLVAADSTFSRGSVGLVMGSVWLLGGKGPSHRADDFIASVQ